mgnify:CR=1 FL=1
MRVRIMRTTVIPVDGKGGLPSPKVRSRMTLTVGCGYDLPDGVANKLVDDGLAVKVERRGAKRTRGVA